MEDLKEYTLKITLKTGKTVTEKFVAPSYAKAVARAGWIFKNCTVSRVGNPKDVKPKIWG